MEMITGYKKIDRGLFRVYGREATAFLDGLLTNDVKRLTDGRTMLAALANPQGRTLAIVRVRRRIDEFLIETESATREKVFLNLSRFEPAGEFFVDDITQTFSYFEVWGVSEFPESSFDFGPHPTPGLFVPTSDAAEFEQKLADAGLEEITDKDYETLRIELGVPKYGVDVDETTVVPEIGIDGLISYKKGCYTGQEIIARIHFRGHIAKRLAGLVAEDNDSLLASEMDLFSEDGKNAGRITSSDFSPRLNRQIALAYVRYDFFRPGTVLFAGERKVIVTELPFVKKSEAEKSAGPETTGI
ncbi:MAG: hypothetical protein C4325_03700 [Blastocatellia bacterium]